jgi:deazaflavin-dependent oxidoreductase (nitroreductase family)
MSDFNQSIIDTFRSHGGVVPQFGRALVLLHHRGARSGVERVSPLAAIGDGDAWLIAASKAGAPDHPAWFHNLLAHPDVEIEIPDGDAVATVPVRAVRLHGADRDAAWQRFTAMSAGFAEYERKTTRVIPVVRLERR